MVNRWSIFRKFSQEANESKSLEEVLEAFPTYLSSLLQCEKLIFFLENELTEELKIIKTFGYTPAETSAEKEILQKRGQIELEEGYYIFPLPQKATFAAYFLLVRRKRPFDEEEKEILQAVVSHLSLAIKKFSLIDKCQRMYSDTIEALARTIDLRCENTKGHSERVTEYAATLAQKLGWSGERLKNLRQAASLHDLGKIGIPDSILKKTGVLTEEERREIEKHPLYTAAVLNGVAELQHILPMAEYHHEHYDGSGYPLGLKGEQIPLGARIIAVADAFDAMTADRFYRRAMSKATAIEIIKQSSGTQFDPVVAAAFIELLEKDKINWRD